MVKKGPPELTPVPFESSFHLVGFVGASREACLGKFMASVGASRHTGIVEDPIQRVKVAFLISPLPGQPQVELVEPVGEKSPVLRFLQQGGGLHHVCYEVADIDRHLAYMQTLGASVVRRPRPAAAFGNPRIAWMVTGEKLLIEYLERVPGGNG